MKFSSINSSKNLYIWLPISLIPHIFNINPIIKCQVRYKFMSEPWCFYISSLLDSLNWFQISKCHAVKTTSYLPILQSQKKRSIGHSRSYPRAIAGSHQHKTLESTFLWLIQQKYKLLWLIEHHQNFENKELLLFLLFKNSEKGVTPFKQV